MISNFYFRNRNIFICLLFIIAITFNLSTNVLAWSKANHQRISRAAIDLLEDWEKEMLKDAADSLAGHYCLNPDLYRAALRDEQQEKIELYKPYVQLPLLQNLSVWHKNNDNDSEICFYIAASLMHNAVKHLRTGHTLEAAKYMGTLLHFIEDNACPVHVVDNTLLAELLPVPEQLEPFPIHRRVEQPTFPIDPFGYQVTLLGMDIVDASAAFYTRFLENRLSGRSQSIPILVAIYAGDEEEADKGRAQAAIPAVKLAADAIHTICTMPRNGE